MNPATIVDEAADAIAAIEHELIDDMTIGIEHLEQHGSDEGPRERLLEKVRGEEVKLLDKGRQQAASMYPVVHQEGFQQGWHSCLNAIFHKLRKRAATDPASKELLIELLDGN